MPWWRCRSLAVFEFRYLIFYYTPQLFDRLDAPLTSVGWVIVLYAVYDLLLLPLIVVSFNRLHDIGFTGFLCLPYLLAPYLKLSGTWAWMHHVPAQTTVVLDRIAAGVHIYGLALALLLLLVPGKKMPWASAEAAA
ncbi:MAG: hypothetical protein WDN06_22200 [Asticcacaulis sp.]